VLMHRLYESLLLDCPQWRKSNFRFVSKATLHNCQLPIRKLKVKVEFADEWQPDSIMGCGN
jgi:hypothetical protein